MKPLFGAGKPNNDYGLGFYCTESEELAKEWAVAKDHDGWANVYSLNDGDLNVLNLNSDQYCILRLVLIGLNERLPGIMPRVRSILARSGTAGFPATCVSTAS